MPRPKTKEELLTVSREQFNKLWMLIDSMSEETRLGTFGFDDRDKNVRDVLIHLHEWHILLIKWIDKNLQGEVKPFLPEGYNWKTYPKLNIVFWETHQKTDYTAAKNLVIKSHNDVMKSLQAFTNEELFTKKYYKWTGSTSLGSYCVSTLSSHYDWAIKKLKKHIKPKR